MVSAEFIKKLATTYQTLELNVRREYFQHLFLSYFYRNPKNNYIYFKGGTALRIVFNSPRFSEDLDFSSSLTDIGAIENLVAAALVEIEREGIVTELEEAKQTSGGYLAVLLFKNNGNTTSMSLEISLREGEKKGEIVTISNDFQPPYNLVCLRQEQLIDEKIQALLSRKKPRDFYDLYFVLRANLLSAEKRGVLQQALDTLQHTPLDFQKELKRFLPKSHWAIIRDFPNTLERELKRFL